MRIKILYWLYNSRKNAEGKSPIYQRITYNKKRLNFATGYSVTKKSWNAKKQRVKGNLDEAIQINDFLSANSNRIQEIYDRSIKERNEINLDLLKDVLLKKEEKINSLIQLIEKHNSNVKELIGNSFTKATHTKYCSTLKRVKEFLHEGRRTTDITLTSLNIKFLNDFEHYLKTKKKQQHNSVMKHIKNLKKIVRIAVTEDLLPKHPFDGFKCTTKEVTRGFLTAEELQEIYLKELPAERLEIVRDVFVFSCYTGIAYCDVAQLTTKNLILDAKGRKWLHFNRLKTATPCMVPLMEIPLKIMDKYCNHYQLINTDYLLPVKSNQKMNAYLKEIGTIAGIQKRLTYHLARHTFATTITLSNGIPIETVSRMLGHTKISTTQIYSKVTTNKISKDMDKLMKSND